MVFLLKICPFFGELLFTGNPKVWILTCLADAFLESSEMQHILHLILEVGRKSCFEG